MKRILALLLALGLCLCGCGAENMPDASTVQTVPTTQTETTEQTVATAPRVGLCLPSETDHWVTNGQYMKTSLESKGYSVSLVYADGSAADQAEALEGLIKQGTDCLVVAAVDSALLTESEQQAKNAGIPVIAYDRLLMDTEAVTYCVGFDYKAIGNAMAQRIVEAFQLETAQTPCTIEFFMGSPEDNNAYLLYNGIMEVLQGYFSSGKLVCLTGRVAFEDTCMLGWSADLAFDACDRYLTQYYTQRKPDILCAASDSLALGCRDALLAAGCSAQDFPMLTGCGATEEAVTAVARKQQSFTVHTDAALLSEKCVQAVEAILSGQKPEVNAPDSLHNNVKTVPAYLCDFTVVDGENCADFGASPDTPEPTEETK